MVPPDRRERKNAATLYFVIAFATIAWWLWMIAFPDARPYFFGQALSEKFAFAFLAPDLLTALVLAFWLAPAVLKNRPHAPAIAWLNAGGQGYAFLISAALAIFDPRAYWGMVAMMASSGIAFFIAIRLQEIDILWGKFRFKPAPSNSPGNHCIRSLWQTLVMWSIFLGIIPASIAFLETLLRFDKNWFRFPGQIPLAIMLFVLLGAFGLSATHTMSRDGDGTPLPSEHANQLVVSGPYRFVRNPMALAGTMQGVAVGLGIGSPLVMMYAVLGAFAWEILVRPLEEADLHTRFGDSFLSFKASTNCWFPSLRSKARQDKLNP